MTTTNAVKANDTGLFKPRRRPLTPLTQGQWDDMRDALVLALDALGDGPRDVDRDLLVNSVMNQHVALRIAHSSLDRLLKGTVQ